MKRAKPDHVKKLTALFEQYPDGLNMRQIQTALQTSAVNAQAALDELGAVKDGAKWLLVDDEVEQVAPGEKAEIEQSVEPETVAVIEAPDWSNAPEGATHWHENEWVRWAGKRSTKHNIWDMDAWRDGAWVLDFWGWKGSYESFLADGAIPRPKPLTQAVFNGMPPEYVWAAVDSNSNHGAAFVYTVEPVKHPNGHGYWVKADCDVSDAEQIGIGYDTTNWETSLIRRDTPQIEPPCDKTASDYSTVFDNIKGRVLSTIKAHNGATADRVRELTGMHPDDIADAVQFMVDHKQLVSRPLYFTTVYEVAA